MHDRLAMALQDDLTERIAQTRARGVLIDISSLDMVDSFIGRMIGNIAGMSRVLDAETVVVGMQPAVAITLVELGLVAARRPHGARRREGDGPPAGRDGTADRERTTMAVSKTDSLPIRSSTDIVLIRQEVRKWSGELGFSLVDQTKMITAASELARNSLDYGGGGTVRFEIAPGRDQDGPAAHLRGPGAGHSRHRAGIDRRLHDRARAWGWAWEVPNDSSTSSRSRRASGEGTRVTITRWK